MQNTDFFNDIQKNFTEPYFIKMYGYDGNCLKFLSNFYEKTQKNGKYILEHIPNPSQDEVEDFLKQVNHNPTFTKDEIISFLPYLDIKEKVADAVISFLSGEEFSKNESIKKNAYIKFMCFIKYRFINVLRGKCPNILFEGIPSKYDGYFLKLLHIIGANVVTISFDKPQGDIDKNSIVCSIFSKPTVHFTKMTNPQRPSPPQETHAQNAKNPKSIQNTAKPSPPINAQNKTANATYTLPNLRIDRSHFCKSNEFIGAEDIFYSVKNTKNRDGQNVFCYIDGAENENYGTKLFEFRRDLLDSSRNVLLIEKEIDNPTVDEVSKFQNFSEIYMLKVMFLPSIELNNIATNAIIDSVKDENPTKQKNIAIRFLCFLSRFKDIFKSKNSVFILFDGHKGSDIKFLKILKHLGVDVLLINPNKSIVPAFMHDDFYKISYDFSQEYDKFPKSRTLSAARTVASSAERELDGILYNDTGFFRDRQFKSAKAMTLKTTFDEITILWNVESNFRPHFQIVDNVVHVPNIFAKVMGIMDGDKQKYIDFVKKLNTENTVFYTSFGFAKMDNTSPFLHKDTKFIKAGRLQVAEVLKDSDYRYSHLNEEVESFILSKIDELLSIEIEGVSRSRLDKTMLAVFFNLDKQILQIIQNFDFTKQLPKIIILDTDENMPLIEDILLILFLNLCGFDILILTPTGYRNVEKYINSDVLTGHNIGTFVYDIKSQNLYNVIKNSKKGFFGKLFGK